MNFTNAIGRTATITPDVIANNNISLVCALDK